MSLRIFDPSSGGETRSWRASAWSASSRYFVCSANCDRAAADRESPATALWYARPQPRQTSASAGPARTPWQSGQRTSASSDCGDHERTATTSSNSVLEPLGAPLPGIVTATPPPRRRASRAAERRIVQQPRESPAASAAASPGSTSSAFTPSRRTSRIDGRSDATIAPARRHVLEQLQRRREPVGDRRRGIRQHQDVGAAAAAPRRARRHQPGERDPVGNAEPSAQLP